ncbi:MAG: cysteine desulfurase [Candidatus Eisenbacteria bacterium]|uniref:cysteine desulfurase n=1 Tax=Eiseniibacteriota bacterium TaxID=2212470 RepID=A0A538UE48_UNCEI|nr:MAG: cysteine desulfurase [Candidatus Eisenbacteria bacterium]
MSQAPREVYADHAATTRPAPEVVAAMTPYLGERFGNASSVHRRGEAAREALEEARARVAALIGAAPEEIVFTASGSEANNLALQGSLLHAAQTPATPRGEARRRLVVSAIEHLSVLETARQLGARGFAVTVVPVEPNGVVDAARVAKALGPDVALVSVMLVNNEIGTVQPVAEIARLAHAAGARVHCDAVQAVGKLPVDVAALGVDLLTLAGHKFHGPPGAAALFVRRRTRLVPLTLGGHQERSRRAGTENLAAVVGLGVAAERAGGSLAAETPRRVAALGGRLLDGLLSRVSGAALNGDRERRLPSIVNLRFDGLDGEAVLHELDLEGVTVSTGSACSAASPGPSHVLIALGLRPEDAHASVRFSLGEENDEADVDRIIAATPGVVTRLRALGGPAQAGRVARASA